MRCIELFKIRSQLYNLDHDLNVPPPMNYAHSVKDWKKGHEVDFGCRLGWEIDF